MTRSGFTRWSYYSSTHFIIMKTKFIFIICLFIAVPGSMQAQSKHQRTNFKVLGNCGMCKNRIETALDRSGIKFAEWNVETKNLEVVYNNHKLSEEEVHQIVAATGHDTEKVKAKDDVYGKLPFCCLYRDHDHSNIQDEPHDH